MAVALSIRTLTRGTSELATILGAKSAKKAISRVPALLAVPLRKLHVRAGQLGQIFGRCAVAGMVAKHPQLLHFTSGNVEMRVEARLKLLPRERTEGLQILAAQPWLLMVSLPELMARLEALHSRVKLRLDWEQQVAKWSPNQFAAVLKGRRERLRRLDYLY